MTEDHLRFVQQVARRVARRFPARHLDVDELEGLGAMTLIGLSEQFDPARGVVFEAFAIKRIRGCMIDSFKRQKVFTCELIDDITSTEIHSIDCKMLTKAVSKLPARLRKIIRLRFSEGYTLMEVANKMGVVECRIHQLQNKALRLMREYLAQRNIRKLSDVL